MSQMIEVFDVLRREKVWIDPDDVRQVYRSTPTTFVLVKFVDGSSREYAEDLNDFMARVNAART